MSTSDSDIVIHTAGGALVRPFSMTPEQIDIETIARHLACQPRWLGATRHPVHRKRIFYSVAEHCVHASVIIDEVLGRPDLALDALLHDAAEAYTGDLVRPLKYSEALGGAFKDFEASIERAMAERFGIAYPFHPVVKQADDMMCAHEWNTIVARKSDAEYPFSFPAPDIELSFWMLNPYDAYDTFMRRFKMLERARAKRSAA